MVGAGDVVTKWSGQGYIHYVRGDPFRGNIPDPFIFFSDPFFFFVFVVFLNDYCSMLIIFECFYDVLSPGTYLKRCASTRAFDWWYRELLTPLICRVLTVDKFVNVS